MVKNFLILFTIILSAVTAYGQDPFLQEGSQATEKRARALTEKYQPELVMTGTQTRLFERKVSEFLLRAEKIKQTELPVNEKMKLLQELSIQENGEMANILSRPQVKRYVTVKSNIQPIAMVVDSVKSGKQ